MIQTDWKLDHTAHAVRDIDSAIAFYHKLAALKLISREIVRDQAVEIAFLDCGGTMLELLSPVDESSTVFRFLEKHSEGLHHICFAVEDINKELKRLAKDSIVLVDQVPRTGAGGKSIAFLHPKSCAGVLIELCEGPHKT